MVKYYYYVYVGENGIIESSVYLPGALCIKKCKITADENKLLTKDNQNFKEIVEIPVAEVDSWYEVDKK
jgi:hypothetical protein